MSGRRSRHLRRRTPSIGDGCVIDGIQFPVAPTLVDLEDAIRPFVLSAPQALELIMFLEHYLRDAETYKTRIEKRRPRKQRDGRLKRLEKLLGLVADEVNRQASKDDKGGELLADCLPIGTGAALAKIMSFEAILDVVAPLPTPTFRPLAPEYESLIEELKLDPDVEERRDALLGNAFIKARFLRESFGVDSPEKREAIAVNHRGLILRAVINQLHKSISAEIEVGKAGRRPLYFRNLFIERLVSHSEAIIGKPATGTVGGRFVEFCGALLVVMQLPADGVDKAVQTALRKQHKDKTPTLE